jgi:predicted phosphodiesterase
MRTVKVDLSTDLDHLEIHTLSDWHIGDKSCKTNEIKSVVEYIKNTPYAYAILNGDLMNNATKQSVSDSYAEVMTPTEQLQTLCELIEPIKDKVLFITQGNHEHRTYKTDGIDLTALMAKQLGIYDKYARVGGVLFVRFGRLNGNQHNRKACYTFYITHGSGGGKREGSKANGLCDLASIVDTDIYLHSHTHLPMIIKENFFRIDTSNSCVKEVEKLFINAAASLSYGGYGQEFKFKPANSTSPIIYLDGHKKKFTATL